MWPGAKIPITRTNAYVKKINLGEMRGGVRAPKICAKQILTLRRDPMLKMEYLLPADILCCSLGPQNMSKTKRRKSNAKKEEMLHDRYSKI